MSRHIASSAIWTVLVLAGCAASAPPERFHTLLPAQRPAVAASAEPLYVEVPPISIPAQVDHPQWIVRQPDGSLLALEQDRWAAPLQEEIRAAVIEHLAARSGAMDVRSVAAPADSTWRVRIDVQRFESVPSHEARIDAVWSVTGPRRGAAALVCRANLREAVDGDGVPALAAAHRAAVRRLADGIAHALDAMRSGGAPRCP